MGICTACLHSLPIRSTNPIGSSAPPACLQCGPLGHLHSEEGESFNRIRLRGELIVKMSPRKNLQCGRISGRPCFSQLPSAASRSACPVHFLWKRVCARAPTGRSLSPYYKRRNAIAALKRLCGKIALPYASRYGAHAFRRRASQELTENGAQWSTIATLGRWRS